MSYEEGYMGGNLVWIALALGVVVAIVLSAKRPN